MDRTTSEITKRFATRLKKSMNINRIILFGSRARGDNFVTSDFDFIVVSDDFIGVPFTRRASRLYKHWDEKSDMEALCYTAAEWKRLKDRRGILLNAQRHGVIVP